MVYLVAYHQKISWNWLTYMFGAHKTDLTYHLCQFCHFSNFFSLEAYIMALMHFNTNTVQL